MISLAIRLYRFLFARALFFRVNKLLFRLSATGLGILNHEDDYASGEAHFLSRHLAGAPAGAVVLDVGANVGNYSRKVLQLGGQLRLYAFEPHPKTFQVLQRNVASAGFSAVNAAVGEAPGQLSLYDYRDGDGSSHASLYRDVIEGLHRADAVEHTVEVITLADFARAQDIGHVHLLKIDTEGNELNVLKGFGAWLQEGRVDAIHFEFNEMNVASRTYFRDFWNLLPNYDFYRLLPRGMAKLKTYSPFYCEVFAYQNIVALRRR